MQWRIGDVTVTKIVELEVTGGSRFILPQATREAIQPIAWLRPHFADEDGRLRMSIHSFVVQTPTRRIVVDTCLGNDKQGRRIDLEQLQIPFLADLAAAGFPRELIDTVLCTHLHVDHVGWNTMLMDGKWVPTFPRARYLMGTCRIPALVEAAGARGHGRGVRRFSTAGGRCRAGRPGRDGCAAVRGDRACAYSWPYTGHVSVRIRSRGEEGADHRRLPASSVSDRASRVGVDRG